MPTPLTPATCRSTTGLMHGHMVAVGFEPFTVTKVKHSIHMQMKDYLIATFQYNDITNRKLLDKIQLLPDQAECIKLFSHLINSQLKWMARINQHPQAHDMSWWTPVYPLGNLAEEWQMSLDPWIGYIHSMTNEQLWAEVTFTGYDGTRWAASPQDIALQLNYHSIHYRAQIQTIIRSQGVEPDFVDYIGTKYRKIT